MKGLSCQFVRRSLTFSFSATDGLLHTSKVSLALFLFVRLLAYLLVVCLFVRLDACLLVFLHSSSFHGFRLDSVPLFYWDPDSWQSECLSRERRVQEQVLQGVQRLRLESEIFYSWAQKYHMEFFYPSQKVT